MYVCVCGGGGLLARLTCEVARGVAQPARSHGRAARPRAGGDIDRHPLPWPNQRCRTGGAGRGSCLGGAVAWKGQLPAGGGGRRQGGPAGRQGSGRQDIPPSLQPRALASSGGRSSSSWQRRRHTSPPKIIIARHTARPAVPAPCPALPRPRHLQSCQGRSGAWPGTERRPGPAQLVAAAAAAAAAATVGVPAPAAAGRWLEAAGGVGWGLAASGGGWGRAVADALAEGGLGEARLAVKGARAAERAGGAWAARRCPPASRHKWRWRWAFRKRSWWLARWNHRPWPGQRQRRLWAGPGGREGGAAGGLCVRVSIGESQRLTSRTPQSGVLGNGAARSRRRRGVSAWGGGGWDGRGAGQRQQGPGSYL